MLSRNACQMIGRNVCLSASSKRSNFDQSDQQQGSASSRANLAFYQSQLEEEQKRLFHSVQFSSRQDGKMVDALTAILL